MCIVHNSSSVEYFSFKISNICITHLHRVLDRTLITADVVVLSNSYVPHAQTLVQHVLTMTFYQFKRRFSVTSPDAVIVRLSLAPV